MKEVTWKYKNSSVCILRPSMLFLFLISALWISKQRIFLREREGKIAQVLKNFQVNAETGGGGWHSAFTLQLPDSAAAITNWALLLWPLGPANTDHAVIWTHPDSSSRVEAPQGRVIQTKNVILLFHEHLPTSVTMTPALPTSSFGEYKSIVGVTSFLKSWISGIAYHPHFSLQTSSSSLHFISTSWRSNNYPTILFLCRFPEECP